MSDSAVAETSKCQTGFLGRTGVKVSKFCLGALTFGKNTVLDFLAENIDEAAAHRLMDRFAERGGNFIDTADVYGPKTSETIVGTWLRKQERDNFVIATKVRMPTDPSDANKEGLSRRHITRAVEESLERLQTDFIDLYQTHLWDCTVPLEQTLRTLNDLVRCGKVRYLGASNLSGWQMQKWIQVQEKLGLEPVVSLQQQYNLKERKSEWEPFQVCKGNGICVLPWSPLSGGVLSGELTRDKPLQTGRVWHSIKDKTNAESAPEWKELQENDRLWKTLDVTKRIATKNGKTQAQVALRWLLQKDIVASVITGALTLQQLDENMDAATGWALTPEEMAELDSVSDPEKPYPYRMIERMDDRFNPFHPPIYLGLLAGKISRDKAPETGRIADATKHGWNIDAAPNWNKLRENDRVWNILDTTKRIAASHGKSQAHVAIRWLLQRDVVSSVIIGARTQQQLDDNMGAANGWTLTPEEMAELDSVSQAEKPYPYSMMDMFMGGRINPFNPPCNL